MHCEEKVNTEVSTAQTPVTIRVMFMKIGSIDTIHDRYSADIMIQTKWREPSLDGKKIV
jgi:hypothetical protein